MIVSSLVGRLKPLWGRVDIVDSVHAELSEFCQSCSGSIRLVHRQVLGCLIIPRVLEILIGSARTLAELDCPESNCTTGDMLPTSIRSYAELSGCS